MTIVHLHTHTTRQFKDDLPSGHTQESYFTQLSREGFERRMQENRPLWAKGRLKHSEAQYRKRLEFEIETLINMGCASYFLMLWDFLAKCREMGVTTGPGRGAVASSMAAWALRITAIDPVQHELVFERFLNPEQAFKPHTAIDLCADTRHRTVDYWLEKFGAERVGHPTSIKGEDGQLRVQHTRFEAEQAGLWVTELLGLTPLTKIADTRKRIASMDKEWQVICAPDDPKTFELFSNGDTDGVFQFDSSEMKALLRHVKPDRFEDLAALLALFRPHHLEADVIDRYARRKHGHEPITYILPELEPILASTYGMLVYQEQFMNIVHLVTDSSYAEADVMRRTMGKRSIEDTEICRKAFVEKAQSRGFDCESIKALWDFIEPGAWQGFLKSHAVAYAAISYEMAYLKAHHREAFMAC